MFADILEAADELASVVAVGRQAFSASLLHRRAAERLLEDGGRLRVAVPDGRFPNDEYQRTVQVGGPGPADHPAADHKVVYIAETFAVVFEEAGFDVILLEWWDSEGSFRVVPWSVDDGPIYRSSFLDHRNEEYRAGRGAPGFTSLIVDAIKVER